MISSRKVIQLVLAVSVLCIGQLSFSQAKALDYDILHNGKKLGSIKIQKEAVGDSIIYKSNVYIEYHMLATIKIRHNNISKFTKDQLVYSKVISQIGRKGKDISTTVHKGGYYDFFLDGEKESEIKENIGFNVDMLFFNEPVNISKVYSDEKGNFHTLKRTGNNQYTKTAPNGHQSVYHYKNGAMVKSEIDAGVISFEMVLVTN